MTALNLEKRAILHFDLEDTGKWIRVGPGEKAEVKKFCHDYFIKIAEENKCDPIKRDAFQGDSAIAYFNEEHNCVNAGIEFLLNIPDIIRRVPYIEHVKIKPRIIAFTDTLSGEYQGAYSGQNLEEIIPNEKDFGKAGAFRIIGKDLWYVLNSIPKTDFELLKDTIKGKRGESYQIYQHSTCFDLHNIRAQHLPPYMPTYRAALYKFYSTNLVSRNGITLSLAKQLYEKGKFFSKLDFIQHIIDWCRAYLEMTASGSIPSSDDWKFKLSYWTKVTGDDIEIIKYSYPVGLNCISYDRKIKLKEDKNIVGNCWQSGKPVIKAISDDDYIPLHNDRDINLASVAAFPVFSQGSNAARPLFGEESNIVIGVLSIDTKIKQYFSGKHEETNYINNLLSSFTNNLTLANYIKDN